MSDLDNLDALPPPPSGPRPWFPRLARRLALWFQPRRDARERWVRRVARRVWNWDGEINLRRLLIRVAITIGMLFVAGFLGVLGLVYFPDTQIPDPEHVDEVSYLDQGWGKARESPSWS